MSRPTDPLRDKIADYLYENGAAINVPLTPHSPFADAILAIVREHATSDAAVEAAARGMYPTTWHSVIAGADHFDGRISKRWKARRDDTRQKARAAITAALGGKP